MTCVLWFLGLDYVSHEDILPYNSTEQVPIQHELFERFLMYNPSKSNNPLVCLNNTQAQALLTSWFWCCFLPPVPPCSSSSSSSRSPLQCQRYPAGVAGEEPSLAGAVRRTPGDHREHPRHRHSFLHGHEGKRAANPANLTHAATPFKYRNYWIITEWLNRLNAQWSVKAI